MAIPANAINTSTVDDSIFGDETELTGDTATRFQEAALPANAGATNNRMESASNGSAVYEAHITKADGTREPSNST